MYYVILSEGAYSDYTPQYYCGVVEITKEELKAKGVEIGDELVKWYFSLPERDISIKYSFQSETKERYDPETELTVYYRMESQWTKKMQEWLDTKGYKLIPRDIPEINIYYDIPTSKNKDDF